MTRSKIVAQAIEYTSAKITRCWSRWDDGSITDSETTTHETARALCKAAQIANIGGEFTMHEVVA